jgi:hypothetical protein
MPCGFCRWPVLQLGAVFEKLGRIACAKFGDTPLVKGMAIGSFFFLRSALRHAPLHPRRTHAVPHHQP